MQMEMFMKGIDVMGRLMGEELIHFIMELNMLAFEKMI